MVEEEEDTIAGQVATVEHLHRGDLLLPLSDPGLRANRSTFPTNWSVRVIPLFEIRFLAISFTLASDR